jgi:hypothetical protein
MLRGKSKRLDNLGEKRLSVSNHPVKVSPILEQTNKIVINCLFRSKDLRT